MVIRPTERPKTDIVPFLLTDTIYEEVCHIHDSGDSINNECTDSQTPIKNYIYLKIPGVNCTRKVSINACMIN